MADNPTQNRPAAPALKPDQRQETPDRPDDAGGGPSTGARQRTSLEERVAATRARSRGGAAGSEGATARAGGVPAGAEGSVAGENRASARSTRARSRRSAAPSASGPAPLPAEANREAAAAALATTGAAGRDLATGTARDGVSGTDATGPGHPRLDEAREASEASTPSAGSPGAITGLPAVLATGGNHAFSFLPRLSQAMEAVRGANLPEFRVPRVRLIPVLIFVCVLMLGVRVGDLMTLGPEGDANLVLGPGLPVEAQEPEAADMMAEEPAGTQVAQADGLPEDPDPAVPTGALNPEESMADDSEPRAALDPTRLSASELRMLEDLADRREQLEERERRLSQREAMIEVAEQRVEEKIAELDDLRGEIETLLITVDAQREEQLASLVRIYEAMRPAEAAVIFNGLDLEVLIGVLGRMDESLSAPILGSMDPARAREVTSQLADRVDATAAQ